MADDILDLDRETFNATLRELEGQGMDTSYLRRQYREKNSPFSGLYDWAAQEQRNISDQGRRSVAGGLMSKLAGTTGMDAVRSLNFEPNALFSALLSGSAEAFDNPAAALRGDLTPAEMQGAALATAGLAMGAGGAMPKPSGALSANSLRGGGMSDPTQTGWTFRDVDNSLNRMATKAENRRISGDTSRVEEVPIRELYATQPTVNPDFATTSSSAGEMPLVVRKGGKMFVRDGHHRLTKQAEGGAQTAPVRFIDLDNADTSTPLLDWSPEKTGFVEADQDILDQLLSANASKSAGLLGSVASDVSQRGDDILGMLKSGRGDEVTDKMLDMGDNVKNTQLNQYLYQNYDLPMDEASRMARAREMGYEGGLLHGTGSDISKVETSKLGEKQNVLGKGFYQTTSPSRAERYVPKEVDANGERVFAEGGNVMPLMTRSADEFDLTSRTGKENINRIGKAFEGSGFDVELRDGGDTALIRSKSDPSVSVFLDSYAEGQNTLMRLKNAFGNNNLTPILQEAGFTGVKGVETRGSNVRVNYNPQDVRSRSARFDPRLSHLSNLTAANASTPAGLIAALSAEQERSAIEEYLQRQGIAR